MNPSTKARITSIDFLRGTIMIIMALDHVRDYLFKDSFLYDPLDLDKTSGILFFTRWATHFCAPIFMLLAGTSAFMMSQKKTKKELSMFLLKRGIWLVLLELVVVNFGWNFNIHFPFLLFITIWALGMSMIALSLLVHLPMKAILVFSLLLIFGHNALDGTHVTGNTLPAFGWSVFHEEGFFHWGNELLLVGYPIVPWIGVMSLGYCIGQWYANGFTVEARTRKLLTAGFFSLALFVVLRYLNIYGDPNRWTNQRDGFRTFLSFLNVQKYPPSLLYLSVTLGAAFLFLAWSEKSKGALVNVISVYGRVPMFYYLLHIYLIHLIAMVSSMFIPGQDWHIWMLTEPIWFTKGLVGYGFSLPVTYLVWILVVVGLYPLCKKYDRYKQAHKEKWWLSYL